MNKKLNGLEFKKTALVSALMLLTGTQAATIDVDGTTCTLMDAITAANTDTTTGGCLAGSGADVLELSNGGTFTLGMDTTISSEVTINGNNSTVSGGSPLLIEAGDATINDTTFSGNNNDYAPLNVRNGVLNINRSIISGNTGGGLMFRVGSSGSVVDCVIENNVGGGQYFYGAGLSVGSSTVTVSNTTISGNTGNSTTAGGGGIWVNNYYGAVDLTITNSTISGNSSLNRGGGISHSDYGNAAVILLENVTITANTSSGDGGGVSNDGADISMSQSIVSGNSGQGAVEIDSTGGNVTVNAYNLFGLNSDPGVAGLTVGANDIVPAEVAITDILDVNLMDNGGPTLTHALALGSPAIDAVVACGTSVDQTGKDRPIDGNSDGTAECDIGAFENPKPDIIFENGFE